MKNFEQSTEQLKTIDQDWEKLQQNEVISRLADGENLQTIIESLPDIQERFCELDTIDCSDGRVLNGRKIGIAGSGLLLNKEDRLKLIKQCRGKKVTTHRDCGAAAKKFSTLFPEEIPAGVETADQYGTYCGQQLAEDLNSEHQFIELDQMANKYHNELAIILDATGQFDSTHLEQLPPHFVCSGAALGFNEEYLKSELQILAGISLGDHGFGKRFTTSTPFYIWVAANDQEDLAIWKKLTQEVAKDFKGRVKTTGFVRPIDPDKN